MFSFQMKKILLYNQRGKTNKQEKSALKTSGTFSTQTFKKAQFEGRIEEYRPLSFQQMVTKCWST